MRKKILIFHNALAPYRVDFFNQLSEKFDAYFYFSLDNLKDQKFNQEKLRKEIHFKFNLLSNGFDWNDRLFRFGIYRLIIEKNPEIILCSEYSPTTIFILGFKILFRRKLRVYIISDDSIDMSIQRNGIRKWLRDTCSHLIDGIIFPSEDVCKWYKKHINTKPKTLVLPIIHSNEIFRIKLSEALPLAEQTIQKYNLKDKKIFLFVGRLVKLKNVDLLLKAFTNVERKNEILIIVGDGEERARLELLATELKLTNSCIFTSRLEGDELLAWYNVAQCFILPSYKEAYGAVVNEALLSGCKVLCSKLAGASELINEENGFTFNPKDESQLTQLITEISSELIPVKLPIKLKRDLMPFTLDKKLETLFSQLIT